MQRVNGTIFRGVCGALVFGALSFGATQAFATTRDGWAAPGQTCFQYCTGKYGEGTQAISYYKSGTQWYCGCIL